MVLGEIVSTVVAGFVPKYSKLFLLLSVSNPVKTHVNSSSFLLLDGVVGKTVGGGVVGEHTRGWLRVSHVVQGLANDNAFFEVGE